MLIKLDFILFLILILFIIFSFKNSINLFKISIEFIHLRKKIILSSSRKTIIFKFIFERKVIK